MKRIVLALCVVAPLAIVFFRMQGSAVPTQLSDDELGREARRLGGSAGLARRELAERGRKGDFAAWQELRAAILATRWLVTPDPDLLDEANRALADHLASEVVARAHGSIEGERALQLIRLVQSAEPSRVMSIVALSGFLTFLCGIATLAWAGRSTGRILATTAGFAAMLLGLWRA